jgi:cystathionine beta-lyase/cystathionine gamma-synthase
MSAISNSYRHPESAEAQAPGQAPTSTNNAPSYPQPSAPPLRPSGASDGCQGWKRTEGERTPLVVPGENSAPHRGARKLGQGSVSDCSAELSLETLCLHASPEDPTGALINSITQSTTYLTGGPHAYSRVSNPTVDALEHELGALENTPPAVAFSTGLAAETALFLTLLKQGDHAIIGRGVYGGTVRLFRQVLSNLGVESTFVDTSDPRFIEEAIKPNTKLVFIESPTNPTLELADIAAIAQVIRRFEERQPQNQVVQASRLFSIKLIVDNTFLTPVIQRPLDLGADICIVSTTKHIEGHSTALGGAVTSRDTAFLDKLRFIRKATGAIQTPFQAWLTSRGLKTLPLRIRQHSENALILALALSRNSAITRVNYPGLDSFPQRDLAQRQHTDPRGGEGRTCHGGVISFELEGGIDTGREFLKHLKLCKLVEHVGSVETLVTHPATMTHADVPPEQRKAAGITDGLIRLSVGLENPKDILADLARAIDAATRATDLQAVELPSPSTTNSQACQSVPRAQEVASV